MDFESDFKKVLGDALSEVGVELRESVAAISSYARQRATFLATIVGQPGFEMAVRAERDAVALYAGLVSTKTARAADARLVGTIQGALFIGAKALAVAAS